MRIFKEKAGVISPRECWVALDQCWMYGPCDTLLALVWEIITGFRKDRNLVG